ncbi:unnamed protein product [Cuscuta campestris]|uniref:Uncharacterized protein n=1 Tax=Cuscuta campestris TaxID=132261 RepID=A0A484KBP2_9ASTE|nr:unnamed protein product [Cuscuta campestris]
MLGPVYPPPSLGFSPERQHQTLYALDLLAIFKEICGKKVLVWSLIEYSRYSMKKPAWATLLVSEMEFET